MAEESYDNSYGGGIWDGPWGGRGGNCEGPWEGRGSGWEGPWGGRGGRGRGGFFRGGRGRGGFPFFESRRDFMDFYAPDFDFQYQEHDHEHGGPHRHGHHHHHHHPWGPRHHGFDFRPGHHWFGRRDNHSFTVDVYPFQAKNAEVKIEDKKLTITNKGNNHHTVQTFKLPEHSHSETWKVDQEKTDTMVILMTRNKDKE